MFYLKKGNIDLLLKMVYCKTTNIYGKHPKKQIKSG